MTFLVDNLVGYLMADVLESQTTTLRSKLEQSTSFEQIKKDHEVFLNQVQSCWC